MKLQSLAVACAALVTLSVAGAALAEQSVAVKLQNPVAAKTKIVAGGSVWVCNGADCIANAPGSRTFATATCKDLAKALGPIAAFSDGKKQMDAARIDQCNAVAAPATQVANR
jgi:hypothetical protein